MVTAVAAPTLAGMSFTPSIVEYVTPEVPSVNFFVSVQGTTTVTNFTLTVCSTTIALGRDSITVDNIGNVCNITACFPVDLITDKCGATSSMTTVMAPIAISLVDIAGTTSFTSPQLTIMFPTTKLQLTFDLTPPVIGEFRYLTRNDTIIVSVQVNDTQTHVKSVVVLVTDQSNADNNITLSIRPDANNTYYGQRKFDTSAQGSVFLIQRVTATDYANNVATKLFQTPFSVTFPSPPPKPPSTFPTVVSAIIQNITAEDNAHFSTVRMDITLSVPVLPIIRTVVYFLNLELIPCNAQYDGNTSVVAYCTFFPYPMRTLTPTLELMNQLGDLKVYTLPQVYNLAGAITNKVNYGGSTWLVNPGGGINAFLPFTQQQNITFNTTTGTVSPLLFGYSQWAGSFYGYHLIEGNLYNGTISIIAQLDSANPPYGANNIITLINDCYYQPLQMSIPAPEITARVDPAANFVISKFSAPRPTMDTANATITSIPIILETTSNLPVSYIIPRDAIGGTVSGYIYEREIISSGQSAGVTAYQTSMQLVSAEYMRPRALNVQLMTSLGPFATAYSQCLYLRSSTPNIAPVVKSFTIYPKVIDTRQKPALCTFIVVLNNTIPVDAVFLKLGGKWTQECYLSSSNSTDSVYSCTRLFPKLSMSLRDDDVSLQLNSKYEFYSVGSVLDFQGMSRSFEVVGMSSRDSMLAVPNVVQYTYDSSSTNLTFQVQSTGAPIYSVEVIVTNGPNVPSTQFRQSVYRTFHADAEAVFTEKGTVSLGTLPCTAASLKTPSVDNQLQVIINIVDVNAYTYTIPYGKLRDQFPSVVVTPPVCKDNAPPIIQSVNVNPTGIQQTTSKGYTLTVNMRITDNLSGVKSVRMIITTPGFQRWEYTLTSAANLSTGSANDGVYKMAMYLPAHTINTFSLSAYVIDNNDNGRMYTANDMFYYFGIGPLILQSTITDPVPTLQSYTYNSPINEGQKLAMTITTGGGSCKEVYLSFYTMGIVNRLAANASGMAGNTWSINFAPYVFGEQFFTITLVGIDNSVTTYTTDTLPQGKSYFYVPRGNSVTGLKLSGLSTTVDGFSITGQVSFNQQLLSTDIVRCVVTDVDNNKVYKSNVDLSSSMQCALQVDSFTSETRHYTWSLEIQYYVGTRYMFIPTYELLYGYMIDGAQFQITATQSSAHSTTQASTTQASTTQAPSTTTTTTSPSTTGSQSTTTSSQSTTTSSQTTSTISTTTTTQNPSNGNILSPLSAVHQQLVVFILILFITL
ncbi:hypothetical protein SAMD00019534_009790 [Acytostelium subglobosum LB1]|uniref:hypothetical protein n=1 Tax=Acytostelium subglobosum LB1 TaxID=1410327 RepID=UPI000644EB8E|nr:hypothetical protein SAMD00019534_009790 [Acytostelium subglobosum LB1]GAM17804.1 hypothetical protein SAMD00019534_009790 [Acytostelium subglobosum LB1]|eukprot:XP_012758400.1 hypothetical protein SAMD00019534_009790 [Acytostelium subglobosum LB1]